MKPNTIKSNRDGHVSKFRLSDAADPRDGVRLIKAFLEIKEPALREKLICLSEDLGKASSDCAGTAQVEESHRRAFHGSDILAPQLRTRCILRPSCLDGAKAAYELRHDDGRSTNSHLRRQDYFSR